MIMEFEIISTESIKPSSPTPSHLKTYKLSLLDQLIPAPYAHIVLFYPNTDSFGNDLGSFIRKRVATLKRSLSETLTRFYPLAGTVKDDLSIDCDDVGAYFAVTLVNCHLSEFLGRPDLQSINRFLPYGSSGGARVSNVQVNVFECGGVAIGVCISHKIVDGSALCMFLKGWAAATAGQSEDVVYPNLSGPKIFPANDLWLRDSAMALWGSVLKEGKSVTRRFVFDASAIARLKAEAIRDGVLQHPTRVEVVSAFLCKCAMAASEEKRGYARPSLLSHVVNLRKRAGPMLSDNCIGNLIWLSSAECRAKNEVIGLSGLAQEVRRSISRINPEFVNQIRGDKGVVVLDKFLKRMGEFVSNQNADYFGFTSLCNVGLYDVDFGWGKPEWVTSKVGPDSASVFMNFTVLMDTKYGDGVEAWVDLDEQEMDILRANPEVISLALLDPSPLRVGTRAKMPKISRPENSHFSTKYFRQTRVRLEISTKPTVRPSTNKHFNDLHEYHRGHMITGFSDGLNSSPTATKISLSGLFTPKFLPYF